MIPGSISVRDFGARGDGTGDDHAAINKAIAVAWAVGQGRVNFPPGQYRVNGPIEAAVDEIELVGEPGTVIDCAGPGGISLTVQKRGIVRDIEVRGNGKIGRGVSIRGASVEARAENVWVSGIRARTGAEAMGIFLDSTDGGTAVVRGCQVSDIGKLDGVSEPISGITITHFQNVTIEGNIVGNVRRNGSLDADGIKVFSRQKDGIYERSAVRVTGNTVTDCEGRFIKLQTAGRAEVTGNCLRFDTPCDLIDNFTGIDSQVHDASIHHNSFYVTAALTGGTGSKLCALQAVRVLREAGEASFQGFCHNDVYVLGNRPLRWIVTVDVDNGVEATHYVDILNNRVAGPGRFNQDSLLNGVPASVFVGIVNLPAEMTARGRVRVNGNSVTARDFIEVSGLEADHKGRLFLEVSGNRAFPTAADIPVFKAGGPITSSLCARDNQIGWHKGGSVDWNLDMAYLENGCDYRAGGRVVYSFTGSLPPPQVAGARVQYNGGHYTVQGDGFAWSADHTGNWQ